jgi:hypothetical protein
MTYLRKLLPLLLFAGFILVFLPPQLAAGTDNRAALVVNMGGGNVQTKCVSFSEEQITGYDLLMRSGLDVAADVQGAGAMVCRIDGTGCPADNCMCQCSGGGDCVYWSYWHQISGNWQYSQGGASIYPITNGMVDGWSWGLGAVNQASPPPNLAFEDVCQVPATATATAVPPTNTPLPTNTPIPLPTLAPEIAFSVDATTITAGACTNLRWQTANISAVYLNNGGVIGEEVREICPTKTETYELKVVYANGEETRSLTVNVLESAVTLTPTAILPTVNAGAAVVATAVPVLNNNIVTHTPVAVAAITQESETQEEAETESAVVVADISVVEAQLPATATPEINWVVVAPQPTETDVAVAVEVEIAALPSTPQSETDPAEMSVEMGEDGEKTAVAWSSYIGFLVIVLSLGLLIIHTSQKT